MRFTGTASGGVTPKGGFVVPANSFIGVDGPICGMGQTAYAAAITASGSVGLYITPETQR